MATVFEKIQGNKYGKNKYEKNYIHWHYRNTNL